MNESPRQERQSETTAAPRPPRLLGQIAAEKVADGSASPLQASRHIRSLSVLDNMTDPKTEEDEDKILAEIELRGLVMNGLTPRNEEEWLLAREVFDDAAIEEFTRWERSGGGWGHGPDKTWLPPLPEHLLPPNLRGPQPMFPVFLAPHLSTEQKDYYLANGWVEPPFVW